MAKITIPGSETLWSVLRSYLNDMFTEIYNKLFEAGKVLTDNNYTTGEKNKLAALNEYGKGYYTTPSALRAAHPAGQGGWFAVVGSTDTVWVWNPDINDWTDTDTKGQVTSVNGRTGAVTGLQESALLSQDYAGEINLSTGTEVSYKITSINTAHTPAVSSTLVENSSARVVLDAGASASLVTTNIGTARAGSDTFTAGKKNELIVFVFPDGTAGALVKSYSIKVLN
jgi:hypothetical protein